MAQADLIKLLREQSAILSAKGSDKKFRVEVPDLWEHRVLVVKEEIKRELRVQLAEVTRPGRKAKAKELSVEASKLYTTQEEQEAYLFSQGQNFSETNIEALANFYIDKLEENLKTPPRGYLSKVIRDNNKLEAIITSKANEAAENTMLVKFKQRGPVFDAVGQAFALAKNQLLTAAKRVLKVDINKSETFFEVGHITAVANLRAGSVLSEIKSKDVDALLGTLEFDGLSNLIKRNDELIKKFDSRIAWVKPQSSVANNLASKHDSKIIEQVRNGVESALDEMLAKGWESQPGSNSLVDAILAELIQTASKSKHATKINKSVKQDFSGSKAKVKGPDIAAKLPSIVQKGKLGKISNLESLLPASSSVNLRSLIPYLNARLPEVVRSNMGINGRLTNRTGRFAESTEIVDIGDNAVVSYTYMLYPYQTFETQGTRDPRSLIDLSIRELAAGLITKKFGTRRI